MVLRSSVWVGDFMLSGGPENDARKFGDEDFFEN
jgi:hypothetical protein